MGLKIFLAKAIRAPSVTAKNIAKVPYKKGASLENFTVNSAKAFKSFINVSPLKDVLSLKMSHNQLL